METEADKVIGELSELFGDIESMDQMDSADFVDNAGKIWDLRQRARKICNPEIEE